MSLKRQLRPGNRAKSSPPEPVLDALDLGPGTVVRFSATDDPTVISPHERVPDGFVNAWDQEPEPANVDSDDRYTARPHR